MEIFSPKSISRDHYHLDLDSKAALEDGLLEYEGAIIMVTHDLGVVAELCDDVLVMYGGKLAEYASADIIYNQSLHPYTQRLLSAFPDINDPRADLSSIAGHPPALNALPPGCRFEPRCDLADEGCALKSPEPIEIRKGHYVSCFKVEV